MIDDDLTENQSQSTESITPPASLNSNGSSDFSNQPVASDIDNTSGNISSEFLMLKRMFRVPVSDVCKTERCKNLMNYLRHFSSKILIGNDRSDISCIDDDKCVQFFRDYIIFLINHRNSLLDNISQRQYLNFIRFSISLWNFTDKFESLCVRMVSFNVHIHLINLLDKLPLTAKLLKVKPINSLVLSIVGILHNINDKLPYTRSQYRDEKVIKCLIPFTTLDNDKDLIGLKTAALFLLAVLVDETENSSLYANDNHIVHILDILRQTLSSKEHYSEYYGYHSLEILKRLRYIASPDQNKKSLINNGVLQSIELILAPNIDACYQVEVVPALELLWSLSFAKECLQALELIGCTLIARVKELASSGEKDILLATRGILWNIDTQRSNNIRSLITRDAQTPNSKGHIMISYNHRSEVIMVKIKDSLMANGFKVWMDVDYMRNCFVDAMAEGVQNAAVLLLGICQAFKDSPHCRQEVKYAYSLGIPFVPVMLEQGFIADGWLGLMCATLIYTEFIDTTSFDNNMLRLQIQLGSLGRIENDTVPNSYIENNISARKESSCNGDPTGVAISSHYSNGDHVTSTYSDHNDSVSLYTKSTNRRESDLSSRKDSTNSMVRFNCNQAFHAAPPFPSPRLDILSWSTTECHKWFSDNGIEVQKYGHPITDIDGSLLYELAEIRITAPQSYYRAVKEELKLNFIDNLKLNRSLRKLNNVP